MIDQKGSKMTDSVDVILNSLPPKQKHLIVVYIGALKLGAGFRTLRDETLEALNASLMTSETDTTTDFAQFVRDDDDMCRGIGEELERTAEQRADLKLNFATAMAEFLTTEFAAGPMDEKQRALAKAYVAIVADPNHAALAEHIARTLDAMRSVKP